jgi:glycosyltransferase involved in cell wall biosynthesis
MKFFDRAQYHQFDRILAVGPSTETTLNKWLPKLADRICVVENAIPVEEISSLAQQSLKNRTQDIDVLFVGRLIEAKGVDILLQALASAELRLDARIRASFVGDGPLRLRLEALAAELGLLGASFEGNQDNVYAWMARARMMILPSRWEGLPMVLLEGMATKVPIIATPVGAIDTVLSNQVSGILVPKGDVEQLSAAIIYLHNNEPRRKDLANAAFLTVKEKYDIKRMVGQTLSLYESALDSRNVPK